MTTTDETGPEAADAGELVVDSTHVAAVREVLGEFEILGTELDSVPEFDLTRLSLAHLDFQRPVSDLDPVLAELRVRFAGRCGGWTPLIGKNRPMNSVFGAYPQTKSHSIWNPERAERPSAAFEAHAGTGVRVGLLDTTIYDHPDLADVLPADHTKFFRPQREPEPGGERPNFYFEEGHGAFMAGLILQQAPKARLVARAALGPDGKAPAWRVVQKLAEFLQDDPQDRIHLLVLASGCRTYDGKAPLIIERAIERLRHKNITVVAAAGNHGALAGMSPDVHITRNSPTWPAALPGVVAVGVPVSAGDYSPQLPWVNRTVDPGPSGKFISTYLNAGKVDLYDGGVATDFDTGYVSWRGTSCAAAFLGGAIAAGMSAAGGSAAEVLAGMDGGVVKKFDWPASQHAVSPEQA